ncbi:TolC family protein [Sphingobacteriaceae bacterium WQ 2009]|uniref:TolC family protein n=1 Tax=Rhinopithecimicrobium faecis TaxID=2820698 RepID=A0A8T4HA40_9SPHI|nr:TolC family protein [Sphingobacteriaceae bacterium WQ 2009]
MIKRLLMLGVLLGIVHVQGVFSKERTLSYSEFMQQVMEQQLALVAERFEVDLADAALAMAYRLPDPELASDWVDNGQRRSEMGYGFTTELSWMVELGGKRKARIAQATSEKELAVLKLKLFVQELHLEAATAFAEVLRDEVQCANLSSSYELIQSVAAFDSLRFSFGEISRLEARQSALEARQAYIVLLETQQKYQSSLLKLNLLMGNRQVDSLYIPYGELSLAAKDYQWKELLAWTLQQRPEFLLAQQGVQVAQASQALTKANRAIDLTLKTQVGYNSYVRNIIAPTPATATIGAGIAMPLKFSNKNKGELRAAQSAVKQQQTRQTWTELSLVKELKDNYQLYLNLKDIRATYEENMLQEASHILTGIVDLYQDGDSSILEVIAARQRHNELQLAYTEVCFEYALVCLLLDQSSPVTQVTF